MISIVEKRKIPPIEEKTLPQKNIEVGMEDRLEEQVGKNVNWRPSDLSLLGLRILIMNIDLLTPLFSIRNHFIILPNKNKNLFLVKLLIDKNKKKYA